MEQESLHTRSRTWSWASPNAVQDGGRELRWARRRRCGSVDTPSIAASSTASSCSFDSSWSSHQHRGSTCSAMSDGASSTERNPQGLGSSVVRPPKLLNESRCCVSHAPQPSCNSTVAIPLCRHVYSNTRDFLSMALRQWWWGVPALSAILLVPGTLLFVPVLYAYQPCCNLWKRYRSSTRPPASLKSETLFLVRWVLGHWQAFAAAQQRRAYLLLATVSARWFHGHYLRRRYRRARREHHHHWKVRA